MTNVKWYHVSCLHTIDDAVIFKKVPIGTLVKVMDNPYTSGLSDLLGIGLVLEVRCNSHYKIMMSV